MANMANMANLMDAECSAVMAVVAHCLNIGGMLGRRDEIETKSLRRELQAASRCNDPDARAERWRGLPGHEAGRDGGETLAGLGQC